MPTKQTTIRAGTKSTQEFVPVSEVRDGVIVLKGGGLRAVLLASSLNFALKSEDEQTAFIVQFQSFLNSLDFSVQIFVQSRMLDIRPYIATLEVAYKEQLDDLMRIQIREYIEFIKSFTEAANIMTKNFYVVIPFTPILMFQKETVKRGLLSFLPNLSGAGKRMEKDVREHGIAQEKFEEYKTQLYQRVEVARQGLARIGVRLVPLNTEELIELFYSLYNPGELEKGKMPEVAT